jgi:hypothetical protein
VGCGVTVKELCAEQPHTYLRQRCATLAASKHTRVSLTIDDMQRGCRRRRHDVQGLKALCGLHSTLSR